MPLTSNWTLATLAALALLAVAATVLLWNRVRSWARWPARGGMIVACQLTACLLVAALLNDANQFYGSWSELFGDGPTVSLAKFSAGAQDKELARLIRRKRRLGKSLIVSVYIPEAGGTKADPALVYLPAAYFESPYASTRFPVVELLGGFPGRPSAWTSNLRLQDVLDAEIAGNRSLPFVAVMPTQNYQGPLHDAECINAVNGAQVETTLTTEVRQVINRDFRVVADRSGWAVMGYSTGGYCALNIAMRHPSMYSAAASLSGYDHPYIDGTTGQLFNRNEAVRLANDPLWRATHAPPPVALLLAAARQDGRTYREAKELAAAVRPPTRVSTLLLPHGAHNGRTWRAMEPVALDWLSRAMPQPLAPPVLAEGMGPTPYQPHPGAHHGGPPHQSLPVSHRVAPATRQRARPTRPRFQ